MKKIVFATVLLLLAITIKVETQQTASYGVLVESLNTTAAGSVIGTSFAVPQGSATMITWTVVNDGSAHTSLLQASADNTNWLTVDTSTAVLGEIRNYGFTGIKFVRIRQVSRTGGTASMGSIITSRAFPASTAVSGTGTSFLASDGSATSGGYAFASEPTLALYRSSVGNIAMNGTFTASNIFGLTDIRAGALGSMYFNGRTILQSPTDGILRLSDYAGTSFNRLQFGGTTSAFPSLKRTGPSLEVRLADDSAYGGLVANNIVAGGVVQSVGFVSTGVLFSTLGASANGNIYYCSDCTIASPCAGGGTGAIAKRLNATWVCN